jgi:ankyrin repeat protein
MRVLAVELQSVRHTRERRTRAVNDRARQSELIDAAVRDPRKARALVAADRKLLAARYIHGETALHFLAVEGFADAVVLLADLGAKVDEPNRSGDTPLVDVAMLGNVEIARVLLRHGANPNATSVTRDNVLHCAVQSGKSELVRLLIEGGARTDYVTDIGQTIRDAVPGGARRQEIEKLLAELGLLA